MQPSCMFHSIFTAGFLIQGRVLHELPVFHVKLTPYLLPHFLQPTHPPQQLLLPEDRHPLLLLHYRRPRGHTAPGGRQLRLGQVSLPPITGVSISPTLCRFQRGKVACTFIKWILCFFYGLKTILLRGKLYFKDLFELKNRRGRWVGFLVFVKKIG